MKKNFIMKRKFICIFLIIVFAITQTIHNPSTTEAYQVWKKVGSGHLSVSKVGDDYILYPSPATYFKKGKGAKGKEFYVKTKKAYKLKFTNEEMSVSETESAEMTLQRNNLKFPLSKVNKKMFMRNKEKTIYASTGHIVTEDEQFSNLWKIDENGNVTPLMNDAQFERTKKIIQKKNATRGEHKLKMVWASDPHSMKKNKKIAFASNKASLIKGKDETSLYVVNEDGTQERLLVNASKYGSQKIVGTGDDTVISLNPHKFNLVVSHVTNGHVQEYPIQGWAESVSPSGKFVVFRKVVDTMIMNELHIYDVERKKEYLVSGMPPDYFYNSGGEWSEDGRYFAFIANGVHQINKKNVLYRDNNILVILDTADMTLSTVGRPHQTASLYPSASISWIDSTHILTYLDDDVSWIATLTKK